MPRSAKWYSAAKRVTVEEVAPKLKWWEKSDSPKNPTKKDQGPGKAQGDSCIDPRRTVYISDCPDGVTDAEVRQYYSRLGKHAIDHIRWEITKKGNSDGCGWLVFRTPELAQWALKVDPPMLANGQRPVTVQPYNEAPARKRVNAKLEETRSKRLKVEGEDSKWALTEGKVLAEVKWTDKETDKRPFTKDFSQLIRYKPKPEGEGEKKEGEEDDEYWEEVEEEEEEATVVKKPAAQAKPAAKGGPATGKKPATAENDWMNIPNFGTNLGSDSDADDDDDGDDDDDHDDDDDDDGDDDDDANDDDDDDGDDDGGEESDGEEDDDDDEEADEATSSTTPAEAAPPKAARPVRRVLKARVKAAEHVRVDGTHAPDPVWSFDEVDFGPEVNRALKKSFVRPSPIQCYTWPAILRGRDVVGLADTGSGKTLAYALPGLVHLRAQPVAGPGDGPVVLFLGPTRELVLQIATEVRRFQDHFTPAVRVGVAYGGMDGKASRVEQGAALSGGIDVVAATPGRLIDFVEADICRLFRVSYLVLDEADHMLDLGFAPQIKNILSQLRPDRQTLMFSATWQRDVKQLAKGLVRDPLKVVINHADELKANKAVRQEIQVLPNQEAKQAAALKVLRAAAAGPQARCLVFVNRKRTADDLVKALRAAHFPRVMALHGDLHQGQREKVIEFLRKDKKAIVVGTDVAARGIDVRGLGCVVNYDLPRELDQYVHRIGRTGRAGAAGLAVSFFVPGPDRAMAKKLVRVMREAGQAPPKELYIQVSHKPTEEELTGKALRQQRLTGRKYKRIETLQTAT